MLPLYHEPHFTFRFGDGRIIPRFHLEGVGAGRRVAVYKIDLDSGEFAWQVPLGEYPELAAKGLRDTGSQNYGGPVVTAGGLVT